MAEKFDIEQYKLDNPGYSEEFYEQVKSNKEGGNPYSIFSSLFKKKEKEDVPKYDTKLPEIKITKETAEKVIKKAINSDDQPDLKDLVKTNAHLLIEKPLCTTVEDCLNFKKF